MDKFIIEGGRQIFGEIIVSGSKNAALPIMTASLLTEEKLVLSNIPYLIDIITMNRLLAQHGVSITLDGDSSIEQQYGKTIEFQANKVSNLTAPYDIVRKMRASVIVLGPLVARFGEAIVSLPGGCAIGARPVDLHIKGLEALGAKITLEAGYMHAKVEGKLKGADFTFEKVSVGATENIMMAATLAEGTSILRNVAREPEIVDLGNCLISMGAKIEGLGTDTLVIHGVEKLHGAHHKVISDRIEAGSYIAMLGVLGGNLKLKNISISLLSSVINKFQESGLQISKKHNCIEITKNFDKIKSININTEPHPGFPTDMQAQFMAMLCFADGISTIEENVFENRYMHVPELNRMGADISLHGNVATIKGKAVLTGAEVMATDLRASMSLVIAALGAKNTTIINRIYHIDRGYERIEEKLQNVGLNIRRIA